MIRLAFKNVFRNKRRTIITILLVFVGSFLVSFYRFLSFGSHQDMIFHIVELKSGYLQVAANGWIENQSLERALDVDETFIDSLNVSGVDDISPRIFGYALFSFKNHSKFISVMSGDPEKEIKITKIYTKMKTGRYLKNDENSESDEKEAIVGEKLASRMELKLGDIGYLVSSQFDGSVGAIKIKIVGIFFANESELDSSQVIIDLNSGRELFAPDDKENGISRYTSLAISVKDYKVAEEVYSILNKKYPFPRLRKGELRENSKNYNPVVYDWKDLNPAVIQFVDIDQITGDMIMAFLILILSFGILSNIQLSIHERKKELGIMLSLGTTPGQILKMMYFELLLIFLPALLLGFIVSISVGYYYQIHPILLTGEFKEMYLDMGFEPRMMTIVDMREFWIGFFSLMIPSFFFSLLGFRKIFKLDPVKIINSI